MALEHRRSNRRRQLKSAIVAFNYRRSTIPCVVREISETGARLEGPGNMIPEAFELLIEIDGLEAQCRVVWRKPDEVGVTFTQPPIKKAPRRNQVIEPLREAQQGGLRKKPAAVAAEPSPAAAASAFADPGRPASSAAVAGPAQRSTVFPSGASFVLTAVAGLPPVVEKGLRAAVAAAFAEQDLDGDACAMGAPTFGVIARFVAEPAGDFVLFDYAFDVTSDDGHALHRVSGEAAVRVTPGRPVWAPFEGKLSQSIAEFIASALARRRAS